MDDLTRELFGGPNQAHVATIMPDGAPHSVPVWADWTGEHLVFITAPNSRKAVNLARDPRVALSVTDRNNPGRMATARGVAERVNGHEAWALVDQLAMKYLGIPYPRGHERVAFIIRLDAAASAALGQ